MVHRSSAAAAPDTLRQGGSNGVIFPAERSRSHRCELLWGSGTQHGKTNNRELASKRSGHLRRQAECKLACGQHGSHLDGNASAASRNYYTPDRHHDRRSRSKRHRLDCRTDRSRVASRRQTIEHLMADQSDVESALVALSSAGLYPQGVSAPSVCDQPCRVFRGWPLPAGLDADLAAGIVNVSVFPVEDSARSTTRFPDEWVSDFAPATLLVAVNDNAVTFSGTAEAGQLAGIATGEGRTYVYRTRKADTPGLVAAYLAAEARADYIVQLTGTTLVLAGASGVVARVVADAAAFREVRRQSQRFRISCWCNDPLVRDVVATAIDTTLAPLRFIALPDGTQGRLSFAAGNTFDQSQDAALYRRDLIYEVEYPATIHAEQPAMIFGTTSVNTIPFIG